MSNGSVTALSFGRNNDEFDDVPGTHEFEFDDPFVIYLEAFANPPGVAPKVAITSPANNAVVTMSPSVTITATTTATNTATVTGVVFYAQGTPGKTIIGNALSNNVNAWSVSWSNAPAGTHLLTALAKDSAGRAAFSPAVTVTNNLRPVAVNDRFTVFRDEGTVLLNPLANDTDSTGDALGTTFILGSPCYVFFSPIVICPKLAS